MDELSPLYEETGENIIEPPTRRNKGTSQFTEAENEALVNLYLDNREEYHKRFGSGSRNGPSSQDKLANEWAVELSGMSGAVRTSQQIKQRINDLKKRSTELLSKEKLAINQTGGGRFNTINVKSYIRRMADSLAGDDNVAGISGGATAEPKYQQKVEDVSSMLEEKKGTTSYTPETPFSRKRPFRSLMDLDGKRNELLDLEIEYAKKRLELVNEQLATEKLKQEHIRKQME